ncbi:MAG: hypothetical protein IIZ48_03850 [Erysipelotrichales bacterium]|nr:hypothetical protein [Erysipelotrichales bacterium]
MTLSVSIYSDIVWLLSIIGLWKIFSNQGVEGWKALIPFYNDLTFAKMVNEEKKGYRQLYASIALLVSFFGILILGIIMYTNSTVTFENDPVYGFVEHVESAPGVFLLFTAIFTLILLACMIYIIVLHCQIKMTYTRNVGGAEWWLFFWLLIPAVAYIYFGFFHHPDETNPQEYEYVPESFEDAMENEDYSEAY